MKDLIAVALIFISIAVSGQDLKKVFTNEYHRVVVSPVEATHFRETEVKGAQIIVRDYYLSNDTLAMEGIFKEEENKLVHDGLVKYYHKNGKLSDIGIKEDANKRGIWKTYYASGIQKSEIDYNEPETRYIQHWNEQGAPELNDGTGIYKTHHNDGALHYTEIEKSKFITSYKVNSNDTIYFVVPEPAEFVGGMPELYKFIGSHLKYPMKARRMGIAGTVYVAFIVLKDGSIGSPEVVKGIGGGCDEAALAIFTHEMKWKPGRLRGKVVKSKFVLPIKFKLA